ncbi:MAG: TonB-dependent receptor [Bacteroidaceae bacterium]|nr:TonB-dependent receptor [Bacteroidaceae bacterium]
MKNVRFITMLLCLYLSQATFAAVRHTALEGVVKDSISGLPLQGVVVYFPELKKGGITDADGHYVIKELPGLKSMVQVSLVGHQTIVRDLDLRTTDRQDFLMQENSARLGEVVVKGYSGNGMLKNLASPISFVSHRDMEMRASSNVIDALAREPGMAQITTGSSISKPVIRGLGYNRVVVVHNGVRQEGQQWGDEHGVEIDASSVHAARILKGPASLMYGSDAIAGVVIFEDEPAAAEGHVNAGVASEYQTNNGLRSLAAHAAGNHSGWLWRLRGSAKDAHVYKNSRDGYVYNSGLGEKALSGMMGTNRKWGFSHLNMSLVEQQPGIVELDDNTPPGSKHYGHLMPYQTIRHAKVVLDNALYLRRGSVKALLSYQQNNRKEYEEAEEEAGLQLMLRTVGYNLSYQMAEHDGWTLAAGTNGMLQHSGNRGDEFLIPDYRLTDVGLFATLGKSLGRWDWSGGVRADHRHFKSNELWDEGHLRFSRFHRNFTSFTGSVGGIYHLSPQSNLRVNLSRGFRAPNVIELSSNGIHEGTFRYEQGNPQLSAESNWQADLGMDYSTATVSAQVSLFHNQVDHFIYAHRLTDAAGLPVMNDGQPTYAYTSGNARLYGGEVSLDVHPVEGLHMGGSFSYVNALQLHQNRDSRYLPFTPAPRIMTEVRYDLVRDGRVLNNSYVSLNLEYNFRQDHFYAKGGTETATSDYGLLGLSIGTDFMHRHRRVCSLFLMGSNITNKAYQNHLSRLKYAGYNPVAGRQGISDMGRNFTLKLVVPIEL